MAKAQYREEGEEGWVDKEKRMRKPDVKSNGVR
jgi:hypothetical protein